jgi:hypothetical protein
MIYPYGHQVGPDQWATGRSYWAFERDRTYDPAPAFGIIESFAAQSHIDLVNLYAGISRDKDKKLYFDSDGHWTAAGHEAVAKAMLDSDIFKRGIEWKG